MLMILGLVGAFALPALPLGSAAVGLKQWQPPWQMQAGLDARRQTDVMARVLTVAGQEAPEQRIWHGLDMGAMMPILRDEAVREAGRLEEEGVIQGNGPPWPSIVARIHDTGRLEEMFRAGAVDALDRVNGDRLDAGLRFYEDGLGQRLVALETGARRNLLDEETEAEALEAFERALDQDAPRAEQILRLIDRADLVAPNVASGLNASLAFSRGFADGGGFDMPLTDEQAMAEAWAQQEQIEVDATEWLQGFLMLAYAPLTDAEMETYIAYASSPEGQALAQVLFAAFDRVFAQTSYDMGLAAALRLQGRQL
ncbi:hypothetical protein [Paracoccus sp. T5]|uniref:hypothetical protein n=1 Tax=Paracoccus sp. T5 TaxID=3402161 RepID=UPI003AEE631C